MQQAACASAASRARCLHRFKHLERMRLINRGHSREDEPPAGRQACRASLQFLRWGLRHQDATAQPNCLTRYLQRAEKGTRSSTAQQEASHAQHALAQVAARAHSAAAKPNSSGTGPSGSSDRTSAMGAASRRPLPHHAVEHAVAVKWRERDQVEEEQGDIDATNISANCWTAGPGVVERAEPPRNRYQRGHQEVADRSGSRHDGMPHAGPYRSRYGLTGTGLAQPMKLTSSKQGTERIEMRQRVERNPALVSGRVVPQPRGHPRMGQFMNGKAHQEDHRLGEQSRYVKVEQRKLRKLRIRRAIAHIRASGAKEL
jgi:hypothetical protein